MSAQAGIFYFDGRPIDPDVVALLDDALAPYGPDGAGRFVGPGIAMVHRVFQVTADDARERQPLASQRGNVMTWDGRLDNREELRLRLWHHHNGDTTDVGLALAIYETFGAEGFAMMIGDWSLVLWDAERQTVLLASDYMGVRPLHYIARPDSLSWSTTIEALVRLHGLYDDIDPRYLVRILTSTRSAVLTPYKGVVAVTPAHTVRCTRSGSLTETRDWTLQPRQIRYRKAADYEEHLRSVFVEALRNRLRSTSPVWAQLSGGLDSSAIVCAADVLVKSGGDDVAPDLCTLSFVSDGSPEADERPFIATVEQQCGRLTYQLSQDNSLDQIDAKWQWITPSQPRYPSMLSFQLLRERGGRVLLTGEGGDSVMANFLLYHQDVADLLQRGNPLAAVGTARQRALASKESIWRVLRQACMELLPMPLLVRWTLARQLEESGGTPPATDRHIADAFLLKPEFARWWREDSTRRCLRALEFADVSQRRLAGDVIALAEYRRAQSWSDVPCANHSHPYLDRRLVELMVGIPIGESAPPGQPRGLMRRAFAPFMPPRVVNRFSKGAAAAFYMRNSRDLLLRWIARPDDVMVLQLDFLDRRLVSRYLDALRDSHVEPGLFLALLRIEQWLQSRREYLSALSRAARPAESIRAADYLVSIAS